MPFFELSFSATLRIEHAPNTSRSSTSSSRLMGSCKSSLSPATQVLQQQIRDRAWERLADAESLRTLESATAAKSMLIKDKSFENLQSSTEQISVLERRHKAAKASMPSRSVRTEGHDESLNSSRLSSAPSCSTVVVTSESKLPSSGNEFEDFMARESAALAPLLKGRKSRSAATFLGDKYSPGVVGGESGALSAYRKKQVVEVLEAFNRCKIGDAGAQDDAEDDAAKAKHSPTSSPSPFPKTEDGALCTSEDVEEAKNDHNDEEPSLSPSEDTNDQQLDGASDEEDKKSEGSGEDEWEVV